MKQRNKMISVVLFLTFATILLTSCNPAAPKETSSDSTVYTNLVWSDEFDGPTLDSSKWMEEEGTGVNYYPGQDGWGNHESQYYQAANTTFESGNLVITAKYESVGGKAYTSSRISSLTKFAFKYGRAEARIKLPYGDAGVWPAFWMMGTNRTALPSLLTADAGWPACGEIDIMEMGGSNPMTSHFTVHYGPPWPNNKSTGATHAYSGTDYHIYGVIWTSTSIKGYMDDYNYPAISLSTAELQSAFQHDFFLIFNFAVEGDFGDSGTATPSNYPLKMYVDWVRVYQ